MSSHNDSRCEKKVCQQCGVTELCPQCGVNPLIKYSFGFGKPKICDECRSCPCEMCGKKEILSEDDETGKQICWDCKKSNFKKPCTMCDKDLDFYGYGRYNDGNGGNCCKDCFKAHIAKPCYRCGEPCEERCGYWECEKCAHTWWCTECDEAKSVYFDGPDSGYNSGFCLNCLLKKELESIDCDCDCGRKGKFYSKDINKWLCSRCVYRRKIK